MRYKKPRSGNMGRKVMNSLSNAKNILIIGAVIVGGFLLVKLYSMFFGKSPFESLFEKTDKEGTKEYTTRNVGEVKGLEGLKKELALRSLVPTTIHLTQANTLNQMLDRSSTDEDLIIKTIKAMSIQTFQLVAISYGQRELRNYRNAIGHLFDPDVWNDMFSDKKMFGTLKFHLMAVLSSKEQQQIMSWLSNVP